MRCCALPTTSIASARDAKSASDDRTRTAEMFGALLTSLALRPLAKPLGFYGDLVVDACARSMARALPLKLPLGSDRQ